MHDICHWGKLSISLRLIYNIIGIHEIIVLHTEIIKISNLFLHRDFEINQRYHLYK